MKLKDVTILSSNSTDFDEDKIVGTFEKQLDNTDELSLSDANLRKNVRVNVFVKTKEDKFFVFFCSTKLSVIVRNAIKNGRTKSQILSALLNLRVMKTEVADGSDAYFVIPNSGELESYKVKVLKDETLSYEDLVAF